jgi:hypothetical protein
MSVELHIQMNAIGAVFVGKMLSGNVEKSSE